MRILFFDGLCRCSLPIPLLLAVAVFFITAAVRVTASEPQSDDGTLDLGLPPWSDSLFGEWSMEGSSYRDAGVNEVRHVGWSWNSIKTMTPPCSTVYRRPGTRDDDWNANVSAADQPTWMMSSCTGTEWACQAVGGSIFNDICMETDPVKHPFTVVGPDCWNMKCSSSFELTDKMKTCEDTLGGQWITPQAMAAGEDAIGGEYEGVVYSGSYCFVPGKHTVLGPACYGSTCYTESLKSVCEEKLGGTVYADMYCILEPKHTVVGPVCRPDVVATDVSSINSTTKNITSQGCYSEETIATCTALGGETIGDGLFCILPTPDYSVLGPFCLNQLGTNCLHDEGRQACDKLGGVSFGDGLFCVIQGDEKYHYYADFYGGGCMGIADTADSTCERDFNGTNLGFCACIFKGDYTIGAPLRWGDVAITLDKDMWPETSNEVAWTGYGFILRGSYSVYGPNCYGSSCYMGDDCKKAGGLSIGGIFCAVPSSSNISAFLPADGLSSGMIALISILGALVLLEMVVIFFCWREKRSPAAATENLRTAQQPSTNQAEEAPKVKTQEHVSTTSNGENESL